MTSVTKPVELLRRGNVIQGVGAKFGKIVRRKEKEPINSSFSKANTSIQALQ